MTFSDLPIGAEFRFSPGFIWYRKLSEKSYCTINVVKSSHAVFDIGFIREKDAVITKE